MNTISRILTKEIILDGGHALWNPDEASIIERIIMIDVPRVADDENIIDRTKLLKTFQYHKELSTPTSRLCCKLIDKIPPALIAAMTGNPHARLEPLPQKQLREMKGEPVWVYNCVVGTAFWMLAYPDQVCNRVGYLDYTTHGTTWIAYGIPKK